MIGKVNIGKSFGGVVRYVLEKEGVELIEQSGVRTSDPVLAIQDFNSIRRQRPGLKNAVWHTTISFAYDDNLSSKQMGIIGKEYLQKVGLSHNQYLMARHYDTKHQHIHIISNRIGFDGQVVSDQWCKNRTANICDQLEEKYDLVVARQQGKEKMIGNYKIPLNREVKQIMKKAITQSLVRKISSFDELIIDLKSKGIEVNFQEQKTGRINGVMFRYKGLSMKGSAVDRSFSYGRLAKELSRNASRKQEQDHDKRRKD